MLRGMRAEQTVLSNRTLGEKNNWLVVEEEKLSPSDLSFVLTTGLYQPWKLDPFLSVQRECVPV